MGEAFTLPQCRDQSPFTSYAYQSSPIELELLTLNVGRLLQVFLNPSTPAFPLLISHFSISTRLFIER